MTRIFIAGSGMFGMQAADMLHTVGHRVLGVVSPTLARDGEHQDALASWAERHDVPWSDVTSLRPELVPAKTDLILAAHSHAFIGRLTRARASYALGYHPSLLPLHRGRDAVRWQARLGERVVGGTIYHLTDRVDGGPIAIQEHLIVPANVTARSLWRGHLAPLGLELIQRAAYEAGEGIVMNRPQDDRLATWEPSFEGAPLYRPELLELPRGSS